MLNNWFIYSHIINIYTNINYIIFHLFKEDIFINFNIILY